MERQTSAIDYVILTLMLATSLAVGIIQSVRSRKSSYEDYMLGERKLHIVPVTLSLFVTFMSSTSLIGGPAEAYTKGSISFSHCGAGTVSYLIAMCTVVPIMRGLDVTSVYEYFHGRFQSSGLRLTVTIWGMFQRITFTSLVLLSPALSLQTVAGIPFWVSVFIVSMVGIIYTTAGGIRGVVLVDVLQACIIMSGILTVLIKVVGDTGGMTTALAIAKEGKRLDSVIWDPDPREPLSVWSMGVGAVISFYCYTFDQSAIQRACGVASTAKARMVYIFSSVMMVFYFIILCLTGIFAYSYFFVKGCDPFTAGILTNRNQVAPYLAMSVFKDYPGMVGVYLATIFSGALSTVSSVLNGLSANTVEDILRAPIKKYKFSERAKLVTAKCSAIFFGGVCIALTFLMKQLQGTFIKTAIGIQGTFGGPCVGIFLLGALVPRANKIGAFAGYTVAILFNVWLGIGAIFYGQPFVPLPSGPADNCTTLSTNTFTDALNVTTQPSTSLITRSTLSSINASTSDINQRTIFDMSYNYYSMNGIVLSFIIGFLVSLATDKWNRCDDVDEKYFFPCVRKYLKKRNSYKDDHEEEAKYELTKTNQLGPNEVPSTSVF